MVEVRADKFYNINKEDKKHKCLVHVIWTEHQMTNLVLNVCFDFFQLSPKVDLKIVQITK